MILATENNLPEVATHAQAQKALGKDYVFVSLEPRIRVARFVSLWEGIHGEVVSRQYYDDRASGNPDMPPDRTVKSLTVRIRIADVIEAMRRYSVRADRDLAAPLRANKLRGPEVASTTR